MNEGSKTMMNGYNNGTDSDMNISSSGSSSTGRNYQTRKFCVDDDHNHDADTIETTTIMNGNADEHNTTVTSSSHDDAVEVMMIPVRMMIPIQPGGKDDDVEGKTEQADVSQTIRLVLSLLLLSIIFIISMIIITLSMTTGVDFVKIMTLL